MVKFANDLEKELGVPVIDGVTAAVKMAEALVDLGKKTSKMGILFASKSLKTMIWAYNS